MIVSIILRGSLRTNCFMMCNRKDSGKKRKARGRYLCSKTVDVAIATFCLTILLYHILVCLERYFSKQTRVMSELKPAHLEVLPSYTFCPSFLNFSYKDEVLANYNTTRTDFIFKGNFYNNGTDPGRVFKEATHELEELISKITIEFLATRSSNGQVLSHIPPQKSNVLKWKTVYTQSLGRCYEMRINSSKIQSPIITMTIEGKAGFYVYLHFPGQFGYIDSVAKIPVEIREKIFVDVSYEVNNNGLALQNCKSNSNFNFNDCLDHKVYTQLMKDFECSVPFLRHTNVFCSSLNETFNNNVIKHYLRYYKLKQLVLCGSPCSSLDVYSGMPHRSVHDDPQKSFMKLYMKTTIRVKTSIVDYSGITMLAEIGGSSGLLLGISLINIAIRIKSWVMGE